MIFKDLIGIRKFIAQNFVLEIGSKSKIKPKSLLFFLPNGSFFTSIWSVSSSSTLPIGWKPQIWGEEEGEEG